MSLTCVPARISAAFLVAALTSIATPVGAADDVGRLMAQAGDQFGHKDYTAAIETYSDALAIQPANPVALSWRAFAYIELGDYAHALEGDDAGLKLAPASPNAMSNACWARALANTDLDRALELCDESLRRTQDSKAYDTRGFLHLRRGEFALAMADYGAALKVHPNHASAHYGRGIAELRLGRTADGENDLTAGTRIEPGIAATYAKRGITP